MRLQFGKGLFDRVEVRRVGWQVAQLGAGGLDEFANSGVWWAGRLSTTTMSPGDKPFLAARQLKLKRRQIFGSYGTVTAQYFKATIDLHQ